MILSFLLLFISFGPWTITGQSYETYPNCVPMCSLSSYLNPPISGGPPWMCRIDAFPSGCQISPCGPGDTRDSDYTCQCTLYYAPDECVTLRCDNGTTSYATLYSSCPQYSILPGSYPAPNYPSSNYPSSNYPSAANCSNYCVCQGDQPPDCTELDEGPFNGDRFCTSTIDDWPTGCVLRQYEPGDVQWCECSRTLTGLS